MEFDLAPFEQRRAEFVGQLADGVAVIPGGRETARNFDVSHPFRQDSDFYFLTGFPEPDAVAVFNPSHPTDKYVLFVRPRDRDREIWDGYRAGVEGAVGDYGADAAYPISELGKKLREYVVDRTTLFYQLGDARFDDRVVALLQTSGDQRVRGGWTVPVKVENPKPILHEMRLFKTPSEADRLRRACEISVEAHAEAMRFAAPGLFEFQVQAAIEFVFRQLGSLRDGYPSIVGSGPNACILHYIENRRQMEDGELLLVDAGAEYGHFSADITRTFPVSGTFTAPQRAVYEVVLAAQRAVIDECAPGSTLDAHHQTARLLITEGLVDLGVVPGPVSDAFEMGFDREFFMHGTGHWLGMDVHDAGRYRIDRKSRALEPGMAFTVEPGVYVDPHRPRVEFAVLEYDEVAQRELAYEVGREEARSQLENRREAAEKRVHDVPAEFLGIGVRIEDDIFITTDGHENLTAGVPTDPEDVEGLCAEAARVPML